MEPYTIDSMVILPNILKNVKEMQIYKLGNFQKKCVMLAIVKQFYFAILPGAEGYLILENWNKWLTFVKIGFCNPFKFKINAMFY